MRFTKMSQKKIARNRLKLAQPNPPALISYLDHYIHREITHQLLRCLSFLTRCHSVFYAQNTNSKNFSQKIRCSLVNGLSFTDNLILDPPINWGTASDIILKIQRAMRCFFEGPIFIRVPCHEDYWPNLQCLCVFVQAIQTLFLFQVNVNAIQNGHNTISLSCSSRGVFCRATEYFCMIGSMLLPEHTFH